MSTACPLHGRIERGRYPPSHVRPGKATLHFQPFNLETPVQDATPNVTPLNASATCMYGVRSTILLLLVVIWASDIRTSWFIMQMDESVEFTHPKMPSNNY